MIRIITHVRFLSWPAILFAVFCGLLTGGLLVIAHIPRNPIVLANVHEVDGVAVRGQWLDLDFTFTREQECEARVERWLWRWSNVGTEPVKHWVQLDATGANPPTGLGRVHYLLAIAVPASVTPGQWYYRSRTVDTCGLRSQLFGRNLRETGDIAVTIVDPDAKTPVQVVTVSGPTLIVPGESAPGAHIDISPP